MERTIHFELNYAVSEYAIASNIKIRLWLHRPWCIFYGNKPNVCNQSLFFVGNDVNKQI